MTEQIRSRVCQRCGKPLEPQPCFACGGEGRVKKWLLWSRQCPACRGVGRVLRCPDAFRHLTGPPLLRNLRPNFAWPRGRRRPSLRRSIERRGSLGRSARVDQEKSSRISVLPMKSVPDIGSTYWNSRPEGVPASFFVQSMPRAE